MQVQNHYYDELEGYIKEQNWEYAHRLIKESGISNNSIIAEDRKNIWFHYLAGLAYHGSTNPTGSLVCLGAFVNMASDDVQMQVDNKMYGIKIPTLKQIDDAKKMLEEAKEWYRELHSKDSEYTGNPEKLANKIDDLQNMACQPKKSGGCFIATATFDSPVAPEVMALREFRDKNLNNSIVGKIFIKFYYLISPTIAQIISSSKLLKSTSRIILINIIRNISIKEK